MKNKANNKYIPNLICLTAAVPDTCFKQLFCEKGLTVADGLTRLPHAVRAFDTARKHLSQ